jgi:FHA domain-containing protein
MSILDVVKRLFAPRPATPVEDVSEPTADRIGEPTADRPPPPDPQAEPAVPESAVPEPVVPEPAVPEPAVPEVVAPDHEPAADDGQLFPADDMQEVRAALEAVADAPAPARDEAPIAPEPARPVSPVVPHDAVESSTRERVGDALVLTLVTPTTATFTVAKTAATIGRGQENTVRLDDLSVSRRHARIAYRQGGYWLSDMGSMGGTWVDGTRLGAPHRLAEGQVIDIGLCRLTVSAAGRPAADPKDARSRTRSDLAGQGRRRR